jgi:hypothetical protein
VTKRSELERGSIIKVPLDDFNGTVAPHFAVILSSSEAINRGDPLVVAGISTIYKTPLPPGQFLIPDYTPGRPHPDTGLSESCAVKGDWINVIKQSDIIERFKKCRARIVKGLIEFVNANLPPGITSL